MALAKYSFPEAYVDPMDDWNFPRSDIDWRRSYISQSSSSGDTPFRTLDSSSAYLGIGLQHSCTLPSESASLLWSILYIMFYSMLDICMDSDRLKSACTPDNINWFLSILSIMFTSKSRFPPPLWCRRCNKGYIWLVWVGTILHFLPCIMSLVLKNSYRAQNRNTYVADAVIRFRANFPT